VDSLDTPYLQSGPGSSPLTPEEGRVLALLQPGAVEPQASLALTESTGIVASRMSR
jgi:hypothetical protein